MGTFTAIAQGLAGTGEDLAQARIQDRAERMAAAKFSHGIDQDLWERTIREGQLALQKSQLALQGRELENAEKWRRSQGWRAIGEVTRDASGKYVQRYQNLYTGENKLFDAPGAPTGSPEAQWGEYYRLVGEREKQLGRKLTDSEQTGLFRSIFKVDPTVRQNPIDYYQYGREHLSRTIPGFNSLPPEKQEQKVAEWLTRMGMGNPASARANFPTSFNQGKGAAQDIIDGFGMTKGEKVEYDVLTSGLRLREQVLVQQYRTMQQAAMMGMADPTQLAMLEQQIQQIAQERIRAAVGVIKRRRPGYVFPPELLGMGGKSEGKLGIGGETIEYNPDAIPLDAKTIPEGHVRKYPDGRTFIMLNGSVIRLGT